MVQKDHLVTFRKNPIFRTQCKIVASVHPKLAGTIKVVDLGEKTRALTKLRLLLDMLNWKTS